MSSSNMEDMQIVEANNGAENFQSIDDVGEDEVEVVAVDEFSTVLLSVGDDEFCRIVEGQFTPYVGQQFSTMEEAEKFYKVYALSSGFDVRKYTTKKWRDGTIKSKLLVCNREGFMYAKEVSKSKHEDYSSIEKGCEEDDGIKQRKKTKVRRVGCKARIRLYMMDGVLLIDRFHAGHNHELVDVKDREFQKLSRKLHKYHKSLIVYNSRLKIGATQTYKMCKEHVNGFENIGASLTDFKNFSRDVKCYINEKDGHLFIDRFKNMAETRDDFYFDYDVDSDGCLIRAFWADGIGRSNYKVFGDAVAFDPTYGTNKYKMVFTPFTGVDNHKRSVTFAGALLFRENDDYFKWVFSRFLIAMGGKEPEYIITDQDRGIISAAGSIFKTARHRFCMWHIMNKVPVKYGSNAKDYPEFLKKLNDIVWDNELDPHDFDKRWGEIMAEHGVRPDVGNGDWFDDVFKKRKQWVLAHCKDLKMGNIMRTTQRSESENSFFKRFVNSSGTLVEFWSRYESAMDQQRHTHKKLDNENRHTSMKLSTQSPLESHGGRVYTHVAFEEFQEEVRLSMNELSVRGFAEVNGVEMTKLKDGLRGVIFDILYNPETNDATCSCRMYERSGILCRHIISIYSGNGVTKIPDAYVMTRWTKDAVRNNYDVRDIIDGKQIEMTKLWSEVFETIGVLSGKTLSEIETFCNLVRDYRENLSPCGEEMTKEQEIEQLLGCKLNEEITILPPKHAKNKGSGKRMLSSRTKAAAKNAKPKRMCNNCKQMAHHDKRNCPNPFAERPPTTVEHSLEESEDDENGEDNEYE